MNEYTDTIFMCCIGLLLVFVGILTGIYLSALLQTNYENQSTDESLEIYPVGDNIDNLYVLTGVGTGIDYIVEIKCIAEFSSNPKSSYSPSKEAAA